MAVSNWLARALARAQLDTFTAGGTWVVADTMWIEINTRRVTFTATTTTATHMITGLLAALQASEIPEFTEITWASPTSTTITGTSEDGVPFTASCDKATAGTGTFTSATTTAATGPNHYNDVNNWTEGSVPAGSDTANVDLALGSILYGLSNAGATLTAMNVFSSGETQNTIGLPRTNANGYTEYRTQELTIDVTTLIIKARSPRMRFNVGSVANTCEVRETGQAIEEGVRAFLLQGTSTSNAIDVQSGSVGLAFYDGDSYTPATVKVAELGNVVTGTGCVIQTQLDSLGQLQTNGTCPTVLIGGGQADMRGTGPSTALTGTGGTIICKWSGTTTAVSLKNCVLDASQDLSSRTFSTYTPNEGSELIDPHRTITLTAIARGTGVKRLLAA